MDVKEKLDEGYIQSRVVVEVIGKPKEHVEKTMQEYVDKIKRIFY